MDINSNNSFINTEGEIDNENKNSIGDNNDLNHKVKRRPYTLITLLLILILTIISVASFAPIQQIYLPQENDLEAYLNSYRFEHTLGRQTKYLFDTKILGTDWYEARYENVESIKYYITDEDNTLSLSNIKNIDDDILQKEFTNSKHYVKIKFNEDGIPEVSGSIRLTRQNFFNGLTFQHYVIEHHMGQTIGNTPPTKDYSGLEVIYIIPDNFVQYRDVFTYNMKENRIERHLLLILIIGAISILLLIIAAFFISFSIQKKCILNRLYNKLHIETKLILLGLLLLASYLGIRAYFEFSTNSFFNFAETIYDVTTNFYLVGIPITFIIFLLVYLEVVYIKQLFKIGLSGTVLNKSILGYLSYRIIKGVKNIVNELIAIDITKRPNNKIGLALGIHLLIVWLIVLTGPFMIILALIYSVVLFKYALKYMNNLNELYNASTKLSEGDFDITIKEDMDMLSPIAKNINNIKEGFKLAVDKEVKSQKMKSELITNVSHDLKTPLTSIITYIDLLKKDDLSQETQREYICILDKKSKRLKVLIEDLFEASKATSGNIELNVERIDVIALFRQTLGELEERIIESSLQFKTNFPENKVICSLDGKRTFRVFENIINNILKYAMKGSRVYIDGIEKEDHIMFIFKNISSYEMNFDAKEITERFVRGDESRSTDGSGLGLSIAKSFVELQKGKLEIYIDGDLFKLIVTLPKASSI